MTDAVADEPETFPEPEPERLYQTRQQTRQVQPRPADRMWPGAIVQAVIAAGTAQHPANAVSMLNYSELPFDCSPEEAVAWAQAYRSFRDQGDKVELAARKANGGQGRLL